MRQALFELSVGANSYLCCMEPASFSKPYLGPVLGLKEWLWVSAGQDFCVFHAGDKKKVGSRKSEVENINLKFGLKPLNLFMEKKEKFASEHSGREAKIPYSKPLDLSMGEWH